MALVRLRKRDAFSHITWRGTSKVSYATLERAQEAIDFMQDRYGGQWSAYPCACRNFHIGSISHERALAHYHQRYGSDVAEGLGPRVYAHLRRENVGRPKDRRTAITKRWRTGVKLWMRQHEVVEAAPARYYRRLVKKGRLP